MAAEAERDDFANVNLIALIDLARQSFGSVGKAGVVNFVMLKKTR